MSDRAFLGVVTKGGEFVPKPIMDRFAGKSSEQITKEEFRGLEGLVEPHYDPDSLARHMEANTYHARCVRTKAQDVAGQGWELSPLVEDPSDEQQERLVQWFEDLEYDIQEELVKAVTDRESVGWLAVEVAREDKTPDGPVVLIKNIPSHTVRAHQDGSRFIQSRNGRKVWFKAAGLTDKDVDKVSGAIHEAGTLEPEQRANEVLWNNIYTSRSDVYGVPDHLPAVGAILGDVSRRDYNIAFFRNFGVPSYAVFISGDYDPGDPVDDDGVKYDENDSEHQERQADFKTPLHRQIQAHVRELANNPHSVLLLGVPSAEGGDVKVEFQPLSVGVKEASFRLFRQDNMKEVLSAHAVPPYRAGIAEQGSLGGNVAKNMDEIYRDSVLAPRQRMLERLINKVVLASLEITDWKFTLLTLDTTDEARELEIATELFEHGAMTPNDLIRNFGRKYGLEPVDHPSMDAHYLDKQPLDQVMAGDVEAVLMSVRDDLLEVATKHAESRGEDGAVLGELVGVLGSLQTSTTPATKAGGSPSSATAGSVRRRGNSDGERTTKARSRSARLGEYTESTSTTRGGNGRNA